jgi:uncharacterized delta-60 repeat protein/RHS repeat-associated protein
MPAISFNPDGSLDTTTDSDNTSDFSTDGKLLVDFDSGTDSGRAVAIDSNGKIVIAGSSGNYFALARLTSAGVLDTLFATDGTDGIVTTDLPGGTDAGYSVAIDGDGKIIVGGTSNNNMAMARYSADGVLDLTFGLGGYTLTDFGGTDGANAMTIDANGKILLAGTGVPASSGYDFAIARYTTTAGLTDRAYVEQDANFNVTSIIDVSGGVIERYQYDSYGARTILDAGFASRAMSLVAFANANQGLKIDFVSGLVYVRNRWSSVTLGRPVSADPANYIDGMNLYQWERSNPVGLVDPMGLDSNSPFLRDPRQSGAVRIGPNCARCGNQSREPQRRVPDPDVGIDALDGVGQGFVNIGNAAVNTSIDGLQGLVNGAIAIETFGDGPQFDFSGAKPNWNGVCFTEKPNDRLLSMGFAQTTVNAGLAAAAEWGLGKLFGKLFGGKPCPEEGVPKSTPTEAYNRTKHYGKTPTPADRNALGAGQGEVVNHEPPLVKRYYEGDPAAGEKAGHQMTDAERRASASDRSRMNVQSEADSRSQGGKMSQYSQQKKSEAGLK